MAEPVRFPNIPLYEGWGAPNRVESDILGLELIAGELPQDLRGCLFRCGPDRQFPSLFKDDIFIDGEGMMHGWYFRDGQVDYKCRWVRNERFLLQEKARRSLFGRYRNRYTNDPSVAGQGVRPHALHPEGEPLGERLRGELQRQASGRALEAGVVRHPARGQGTHRALEAGLQHRPAAQGWSIRGGIPNLKTGIALGGRSSSHGSAWRSTWPRSSRARTCWNV